MRALFVVFLAMSSPVFGADADSFIGTWKLVSWQVIVENEPAQDLFGSHSKGFLILKTLSRGKHPLDTCIYKNDILRMGGKPSPDKKK
jgi:hypothetical protein